MGRRLARFTLRHRFWLGAMESPVVSGGECSLLDLELAARVCAIPYDRLAVGVPRLLSRGPGWCGKLAYLVRMWRRRVEREYPLFQAYLLDHGCPPATFESDCEVVGPGGEDGAQESGSLPGVLGLVTGLMRGGVQPETVWGFSPGEAEWYLAGVFLHRGVDVGLKTAEDEDMEEYLRERKKEEPAASKV